MGSVAILSFETPISVQTWREVDNRSTKIVNDFIPADV